LPIFMRILTSKISRFFEDVLDGV